jgi:hypothetical protein
MSSIVDSNPDRSLWNNGKIYFVYAIGPTPFVLSCVVEDCSQYAHVSVFRSSFHLCQYRFKVRRFNFRYRETGKVRFPESFKRISDLVPMDV